MRRRDKGSQIAELALVLPLVAFFALLACEGVGIVRAHQLISNAAREAARVAIMPENHDMAATLVPAVATCYLVHNRMTPTSSLPSNCSAGVDTSNLDCVSGTYSTTVDPDVAISPSIVGVRVHVGCGYHLSYLPNLSWFGISNTIPLSATVVWRKVNL